MNIGMIGLGKLGLPVALAIEDKGHSVCGADPSEQVAQTLKTKQLPYQEIGADKLLEASEITLIDYESIAETCDIIFIAVQTPHEPEYEGVTRLPKERKDFDYSYLRQAYESLAEAIKTAKTDPLVVIISTCLPGTVESLIDPKIRTVYNPFFIAMGTVIPDFLNPEFVLIGTSDIFHDDDGTHYGGFHELHNLYSEIVNNYRPFYCSIREAEAIKVLYNTRITTKICVANSEMELCHKIGVNHDTVTEALGLATERIVSTRYTKGGMGDGGGCHPRDNIALSWLAKNVNISFDWWEMLMLQRERQTEWLADLICEQHFKHPELPMVILGRAFKPETNIETGSPSILLGNILDERGINFIYRKYIGGIGDMKNDWPEGEIAIIFIGTAHELFKTLQFPKGSIVIDPHRIIEPQDGIKLISIGS